LAEDFLGGWAYLEEKRKKKGFRQRDRKKGNLKKEELKVPREGFIRQRDKFDLNLGEVGS